MIFCVQYAASGPNFTPTYLRGSFMIKCETFCHIFFRNY